MRSADERVAALECSRWRVRLVAVVIDDEVAASLGFVLCVPFVRNLEWPISIIGRVEHPRPTRQVCWLGALCYCFDLQCPYLLVALVLGQFARYGHGLLSVLTRQPAGAVATIIAVLVAAYFFEWVRILMAIIFLVSFLHFAWTQLRG